MEDMIGMWGKVFSPPICCIFFHDASVKIILQLTWVTFAIGAQWSALGVGVGLREGEGRPRSAIGDEERERER